MSARSGLVGKNPPGPIWGPLGPFFAWAGKIRKMQKFCLFSLVGPWALFTRFGALAAIHPRWGNRYSHNRHVSDDSKDTTQDSSLHHEAAPNLVDSKDATDG